MRCPSISTVAKQFGGCADVLLYLPADRRTGQVDLDAAARTASAKNAVQSIR